MAKETFRGGVHPNEAKEFSRNEPLKVYETKGDVILPVSQHIGRPAKAVVKKGDPVLVGQIIAEADGFVSANIASSVSGTVKAVEKRRVQSGAMAECIVIQNDGLYTPFDDYETKDDLKDLSNEEILKRIKDAGIVGMGGAGFPAHVKLAPSDPLAIKYIIANGAECEPYLTCDDQLMRSKSAEIIEGLQIILKLFPNAQGVIAIERNKPEAIAAMDKAEDVDKKISVHSLRTKYPQGGEKSLVKAITGIDTTRAALPASVGCIVCNVGTIYAIRQAVLFREPSYRRAMSVTGDAVKNPCNIIVRNGTLFSEIVEAAGGIKEGVELKKALCGGPMMGFALGNLDTPAQKVNNGLTLLSEDAVEKAAAQMTACLHCGRCTTVCPMGLMPQMMAEAFEANNLERYEKKLYGLECIECGSCTYICPAKRPLMQQFRQAKQEIAAVKALEKAKAAGGAK